MSEVFGAIRIDIDQGLLSIVDEYTSECRQIFDNIGLDLVDELQRNSPGDTVAGGWDFILPHIVTGKQIGRAHV